MPFAALIREALALGFRPATAVAVLAFNLLSTLFESFGLGMLLPVFQLIESGSDAAALAAESRAWRWLTDIYAAIGLEVTIPALLATTLAAILARQVFVYARTLYATRAGLALTQGIRDRAFRGFVDARLDSVEDDPQGHFINDITIEADRATLCVMALITLGGHVILGAVYLCFLIALSWQMTVMAAAVMVLASLPTLRLMRRSSEVSTLIVKANRSLVDFLVERLRSLRLMRLSGTEAAEHAELARRTRKLFETTFLSTVLLARIKLIIEPAVVAAGLALLYLGVVRFGVRLEQIGLFLVIVLRLLPVLVEAMRTRQQVLVTGRSLTVTRERLDELERVREDSGGGRPFAVLADGITLDRVTYSYRHGPRPALHDLSVTIPARKITALLGPSGSGKSTLIDLLPRLRDPQSGRILFDGVPAPAFALDSLRAGIAYAPQSPQLFNVTVGDHIRYGRADATDTEVERAAQLAGAHDFIIRLAEGYRTRIGEGGVRLSGGQRQRLDLARVLLKEAPVLILDEPTSQLDADAEDHFRDTLPRIRSATDATVIVVAHRLSTISLADWIIVLDDGRLADAGTHEALVARGGWYASAHRKQGLGAARPAAPTPAAG